MNSGGDDRHGCPGVVPVDGEPYACGLLLGHCGACTPHVGDYLPPPMLHPLDDVGPGRPCLLCGRVIAWWEREEPTAVFRHFEGGQGLAPEPEMLWRFVPCGCELREILPDGC